MRHRGVPTEIQRALRFCVVGTTGLILDGGLLKLMILGSINPIVARSGSASIAIVLTFLLNKTWTFAEPTESSTPRLFRAYLRVQGLGFLCNLMVFAIILAMIPSPIVALIISSGAAMVVNYLGLRFWAFRGMGLRDEVVAGCQVDQLS
jgi:putative flippase GtrA